MEKNDHPYPVPPALREPREDPKEKEQEQEYNENYL